MDYEYGKPVKANIGGKVQLAFLTGPAHDVAGASGPEQKFKVTGLDGVEREMAYTGEKIGPDDGGFFTHG